MPLNGGCLFYRWSCNIISQLNGGTDGAVMSLLHLLGVQMELNKGMGGAAIE